MSDIDQGREVERFRKAIYPLWAPFFARAAQDDKMTEIQTIHAADQRIYDWLEANEHQKPARIAREPEAKTRAREIYSRSFAP